METLLIQLTNQKAIGLLHEMEALNLIKLLDEPISENQSFSEKYAGKLPSAVADDLQNYVTASRKEWSD
ncbi:hypothetical protein [Mucilaginibacter arboris]|uniref:Uncharacterized protein n=1 Tax=Mucilaginibacter arboris TaxID=2682090 RepID=A0A7K1SXY5_9SPHI|nr:hypothetical protein [Mucilaginibacter arboris]MVN22173.1 hypothetical protein [Mucilaginibacter arboris]